MGGWGGCDLQDAWWSNKAWALADRNNWTALPTDHCGEWKSSKTETRYSVVNARVLDHEEWPLP